MLFSPTIGTAITAGYWFLRANATIGTYFKLGALRHPRQLVQMEGAMAKTDKPSTVGAAAFIVAWGLAGLAPTVTMAQIPFPMIPNFNFGPQHYRSGSVIESPLAKSVTSGRA
jgi:hypothetical protein